jgi:hypothetical protein
MITPPMKHPIKEPINPANPKNLVHRDTEITLARI